MIIVILVGALEYPRISTFYDLQNILGNRFQQKLDVGSNIWRKN